VINSRWRIGIAGVIILALSATIVLWHSYKITTQSQDPDGDVNAIRAKAEQGDVQAEFRLASMYGSGNGAPRDYSLALRWYRAAAEKK
jgi:TPR repeat protein